MHACDICQYLIHKTCFTLYFAKYYSRQYFVLYGMLSYLWIHFWGGEMHKIDGIWQHYMEEGLTIKVHKTLNSSHTMHSAMMTSSLFATFY